MYARTCDKCRAIRACKHTFGRYWEEKSHGGSGCINPIDDVWAKKVIEAVYGIRYVNPKVAKQEEMKLT